MADEPELAIVDRLERDSYTTPTGELRQDRADAAAIIKELDRILRCIIGNANESPRFGPFDQIDNTGAPYQSQAFHDALESGRKFLARHSLTRAGANNDPSK